MLVEFFIDALTKNHHQNVLFIEKLIASPYSQESVIKTKVSSLLNAQHRCICSFKNEQFLDEELNDILPEYSWLKFERYQFLELKIELEKIELLEIPLKKLRVEEILELLHQNYAERISVIDYLKAKSIDIQV